MLTSQIFINENISETLPLNVLIHEPCKLGESPLWHNQQQALYWVDIFAPALHCFDPATKTYNSWSMPTAICAIAEHENGGLIAAMEDYLAEIELPSGKVTPLLKLSLPDNVRCNDGKCDRVGRFWFGTTDIQEKAAIASLYCYDKSTLQQQADNIIQFNGIAWNLDNTKMYFGDSLRHTIYENDYDIKTGHLTNQRSLIYSSSEQVVADGMTIDQEGYLWSAQWNGSCLKRFSPRGQLDRIVYLPAPRITSCCFGGIGYNTLYVTSMSEGLTIEDLAKYPCSGLVFALEIPGICGMPETFYQM